MSLRDVVGHSDLALYPEVALVLFLAAFAAIAWRVWRRDGAEDARAARLPLEGEAEGRPS